MKFPQSMAAEIGENCAIIGKYGCLAMCYAYCMGLEPDEETEMIKTVSHAIDCTIIGKDCTVIDAERYLEWLTGKKWEVSKKAVTSIEDIAGPTPVAYEYNGKKHWVVVENGKIVFNSIINSQCVNKGKPVDSRPIKLSQRW